MFIQGDYFYLFIFINYLLDNCKYDFSVEGYMQD